MLKALPSYHGYGVCEPARILTNFPFFKSLLRSDTNEYKAKIVQCLPIFDFFSFDFGQKNALVLV